MNCKCEIAPQGQGCPDGGCPPDITIKDVIVLMQTTIDNHRRESARLVSLLRRAREIIQEHHADGVMEPDVCPICCGQKKAAEWFFEVREVLE